MKNRFKTAFIDVVPRLVHEDRNARTTIPFVLCADVDHSTPLVGSQDTVGDDKEHFWNHTLVVAYQPPKKEAADGVEEETTGMTLIEDRLILSDLYYSAIFVETIREAFAAQTLESLQGIQDQTTAHELGHGAGPLRDHTEPGLMADGNTLSRPKFFFAESIRRFRRAIRWQAEHTP